MAMALEDSFYSSQQRKYTRETEIRHLRSNDVYMIAVILDENDCWRKLMEIIPQEPQKSLDSGPLKYTNDHIRLIQNAVLRPGESRLYGQILFDEWGTSGQKHERPTLAVLLHLLVRAELFRAADFVAEKFLDEPPPLRPLTGPAARIDISIDEELYADVVDMVNDSAFFPDTCALNDHARTTNIGAANNNKDYYAKYHVAKYLHPLNSCNEPPQRPPRRKGPSRLALASALAVSTPVDVWQQQVDSRPVSEPPSANIPKFSMLMQSGNTTTSKVTASSYSESGIDDSELETIDTTARSEAPIPIISILGKSTRTTVSALSIERNGNVLLSKKSCNSVLPMISALLIRDSPNLDSQPIESEYSGVPSTEYTSSSQSDATLDSNEQISESGNNNSLDYSVSSVHPSSTVSGAMDGNVIPILSILQDNDSRKSNSTSFRVTEQSEGLNSKSIGNIPCLSALNDK